VVLAGTAPGSDLPERFGPGTEFYLHYKIVGGIAMLWGYFSSWLTGARRYADPEFRRFLRKYQWRCLLMGKKLATRRLDAEQSALFRPPVETRG
jgi:hypothetical protein